MTSVKVHRKRSVHLAIPTQRANIDGLSGSDVTCAAPVAVKKDSAAANHVEGRGAAARARELGYKLPLPKQYDLPFSTVQLLEDRLDVPLRTKKPTCYFVDSMADLFHEAVPDEYIGRVFETIRQAGWHLFLILTKRPERMREWMIGRVAKDRRYADDFAKCPTLEMQSSPAAIFARTWAERPYPNVWLGTSVEDQKAADERIPHLLATPAAVRFLSENDYVLVTAGECHLTHMQAYPKTGTHVVTIKGVAR